ncbi:MAG: hypothetical protein Q4B73_06805 [Lachnospiraceae bacterium]|nr:hypothetical protein [Lachnospiraceae bacterium]
MGLLQHDDVPKSAEEHRQRAEELRNEVKTLRRTFLKTGVFVLAALVALVLIALGWFVNNNKVTAAGMTANAQAHYAFYLATEKPVGHQGVFDDNGSAGSLLERSLIGAKRVEPEAGQTVTFENLPKLKVGPHEYEADGRTFIVADADGVSLMVNATSHVGNDTEDGFLAPGSKGAVTFYIIPLEDDLGDVDLTLSLAAYGITSTVDESGQNVTATGALITGDDQFTKLLSGHMLIFKGKDADGNYSDRLMPVIKGDGTISYPFKMPGGSWQADKPVEITLYWLWPHRFDNYVYPGQPESVFRSDCEEQRALLTWVNQNKDHILVTTGDLPGDASADMSNADQVKWSSGYNRGDQLIGNTAGYCVWTINAADESGS